MENNIQNKLLPPGCLPPALSSGALLRTMYGTIWPVQKEKKQLKAYKIQTKIILGKGAKKKEKKLTSVSFMYVCVAGNGEMLVFFSFFPYNSLNGQLSFRI